MQLIRGLYNLPADLGNTVLTIGNFDGLHRGHHELLSACVKLAQHRALVPVAITFEPHPQTYFLGKKRATPKLMSFRDKFILIKSLGIRYLCVLHFTSAFSTLSAEDFVLNTLLCTLKMKAIVVGDDFHFGAQRSGDYSLLTSLSKRHHFFIQKLKTCVYAGSRISSSRLRATLSQGDLKLAHALLGRHYQLSGRVIKGAQRGRQLGFPTANIHIKQRRLALSGIFAVMVYGLGPNALPGIASMGRRPMYPAQQDILEVYLLDFEEDIYQSYITITFLKKLREEMNFPSAADLIKQIQQDVESARAFFCGNRNIPGAH